MMKKLKLLIGLICLFPVYAMAETSTAMHPEKPEIKTLTLMLDWFVNPDHGPIIIAQQKGYFKEEGVKITIEEPADPSLPPKLVAAGKVDLAVYYQPSLLEGIARGLPLAWAGTLIDHPLDGIIVLANGPIKSLKDLKGKKIGMSNSSDQFPQLDAIFKPYGFSSKDVTLVNVGWNLSSALMSGQVDAISGGYRNFELNVLSLHGKKGRMFFYEKNGVPFYDELIFITNSKHHDVEAIRRFLRAIKRASDYIVNHPEASWNVFKSYNPRQLDNTLNHLAWKDTVEYFATEPAAENVERYERYAQFLKQHRDIGKTLRAKDMMIGL
ncbi:MAG: ABC transporter substrate-binding protein [Endozoicomonas sp. (ex Botrylloides leachii)]|nr:ABC transporter substrate-binding protein [Endozoicomonas sp. (ex Botrylloides leachii)]